MNNQSTLYTTTLLTLLWMYVGKEQYVEINVENININKFILSLNNKQQ